MTNWQPILGGLQRLFGDVPGTSLYPSLSLAPAEAFTWPQPEPVAPEPKLYFESPEKWPYYEPPVQEPEPYQASVQPSPELANTVESPSFALGEREALERARLAQEQGISDVGLGGESFGTRQAGTPLEQLRQERLSEGRYGGLDIDWAKLAALGLLAPAAGELATAGGALPGARVAAETAGQMGAARAIPEIPGYESLPEWAQVAARNAPYFTPAGAVGRPLAKATGMGLRASVAGLTGTVAGHYLGPEVGVSEGVGEAAGGILGAVAPTVARIGAPVVARGISAVTQAGITPAPTVLRLAVKPWALSDEGVEAGSMAATYGAKTLSEPSGVRILRQTDQLLPGEVEMFRGTTDAETALRKGAFMTPDPGDAQAYAEVASKLESRQPGILRRLATEEAGGAKLPGEGASDVQPRQVRLAGAARAAEGAPAAQQAPYVLRPTTGPGPGPDQGTMLPERGLRSHFQPSSVGRDDTGIFRQAIFKVNDTELTVWHTTDGWQLDITRAGAGKPQGKSTGSDLAALRGIRDVVSDLQSSNPEVRFFALPGDARRNRIYQQLGFVPADGGKTELLELGTLRGSTPPTQQAAPATPPAQAMDEETYLATHGAGRQGIGDPALSKNIGTGRPRQVVIQRQAQRDAELVARRDVLRQEYADKVTAGEIRPPTWEETIIAKANGMPDRQDVQAARRVAAKHGIDWQAQEATAAPAQPRQARIRAAVPPVEPPTGNPVDRLTDIIQTIRKLPEETEALRHAARQQRVAIGASQLERGGRTPEAYRQARGALAGEMPRAPFEAPTERFSPEDVQQLRTQLSDAKLRFYEEVNTEGALTKVLDGRLNEIRNFELELLDRVYGPKLSMAIAEKMAPPGLRDKIFEYYLSNILSGVLTQARNITGNFATAIQAPFEQLGSAVLEQPIAKLQGRAPERFWEEAPASLFGLVRGVPEGVTGALRVLKEGFNPLHAGRVEQRTRAIGGVKGQLVRLPLTGLEAADTFFRSINFSAATHQLAVRQARREGLKGSAIADRVAAILSDQSDEFIEQATKQTNAALFRDDPSRYGEAIMSAREKAPVLNFLIPFVRTPDRLIAYGVRRSPLGLFDVPMWKRLMNGNPEAVDELTQTLMGSTIAAGVGSFVAAGILDITAGAPVDRAERDRFYRSGKQPFSVKIPGVGWIEYKQIPALNVTLTTTAAAVEAFRKGQSIDEFVPQLGATIAQNIFDQSYLSGIADFFELFSNARDPVEAGTRFAGRHVSGYIPASGLLRNVANVKDPTIRQPEGVIEQLQTGIPGLSQNIPPRLTAFGEESQRPTPASSIRVSADRQTAVDAELGRLNTEIGFTGDQIANVKLTREQEAIYQRTAGQLTYTALSSLIEAPAFQALTDGDRQKIVEKARDWARDSVRDPINKITKAEQWEALTPAQQRQVIDAALVAIEQELVGAR